MRCRSHPKKLQSGPDVNHTHGTGLADLRKHKIEIVTWHEINQNVFFFVRVRFGR